MNDRKQHVIEKAHQLFIEKGFHSTSIQDILDFSGISKGTFYNYFQSKNELLMAIFRSIFSVMVKERNDLLRGQNPQDPDIFIKQIELQMRKNRENKLIPLFEEVFFSNDQEMKDFLEISQLKTLRWVHSRLTDLFSAEFHPYLLDAAVMLKGILQQNIRHYTFAHGENASLTKVVRFSVGQIIQMVKQAPVTGEQLLPPHMLDEWLPSICESEKNYRSRLTVCIAALKKAPNTDHEKLEFIREELLESAFPRKFLIDSVMLSLKTRMEHRLLVELEELIEEKFCK